MQCSTLDVGVSQSRKRATYCGQVVKRLLLLAFSVAIISAFEDTFVLSKLLTFFKDFIEKRSKSFSPSRAN